MILNQLAQSCNYSEKNSPKWKKISELKKNINCSENSKKNQLF